MRSKLGPEGMVVVEGPGELLELLGAMVTECRDAIADVERDDEDLEGDKLAVLLSSTLSRQLVLIQVVMQLLAAVAAAAPQEERRIILP